MYSKINFNDIKPFLGFTVFLILLITLFILFLHKEKNISNFNNIESFNTNSNNYDNFRSNINPINMDIYKKLFINRFKNGEEIYKLVYLNGNLKPDEYEDLVVNLEVDIKKIANKIFNELLSDDITMENIDEYMKNKFYKQQKKHFKTYLDTITPALEELLNKEVDILLTDKIKDYIKNVKGSLNKKRTGGVESFYINLGQNNAAESVEAETKIVEEDERILNNKNLLNYVLSQLSTYVELDENGKPIKDNKKKKKDKFVNTHDYNNNSTNGNNFIYKGQNLDDYNEHNLTDTQKPSSNTESKNINNYSYSNQTAYDLNKIYSEQQEKMRKHKNMNELLINPVQAIEDFQNTVIGLISNNNVSNNNEGFENTHNFANRGQNMKHIGQTKEYNRYINYNNYSNVKSYKSDGSIYNDGFNENNTLEGFENNNLDKNKNRNKNKNSNTENLDSIVEYTINTSKNLLSQVMPFLRNSNELFNGSKQNAKNMKNYGIMLIIISFILFIISL